FKNLCKSALPATSGSLNLPYLHPARQQACHFRLFVRGLVAIFPLQRRRLRKQYTPASPSANPRPRQVSAPKNTGKQGLLGA
ncbi:hypothetical protein, partial [Pseudarthrobacter sp. NamB4]|uniref:hypothetical protein n=1 Tax=Pseudarthrobacter sp. NamB4 TaxID=2576837 RepID=UPI00197AE9D4